MVNESEQRPRSEQLVAQNIRALRKARGWRLEDLSAALERIGYPMSVKVLSKTENSLRTISASDLAAFAEVLGVNVGTMFAELAVPDAVPQLVSRLGELNDELRPKEEQLDELHNAIASMTAEVFRIQGERDAILDQLQQIANDQGHSANEIVDAISAQYGDEAAQQMRNALSRKRRG